MAIGGRRPPNEAHPLGHGRELYFWSFIVSLLIFALGASVSFYEGVMHFLRPRPIEDPMVSYIVLGLSFLFEGSSWVVATRRVREDGRRYGYYQAFIRSKDPPAFMVLLEDSAALIGILVAATATAAAVALKQPVWDGIGSILIGVLLGITSIALARESKSLLIGEPADPDLARSIVALARRSPGVLRANGLLTVQLSPTEVVAAQHRVRGRQAGGRDRAVGGCDRARHSEASSGGRRHLRQAADAGPIPAGASGSVRG